MPRNSNLDPDIAKYFRPLIEEIIVETLSEAVKDGLKPVYTMVEQIQTTNDLMVKQTNEDRKDIANIKIDQAKTIKQNEIIIQNQNNGEEKIADILKADRRKLPQVIEDSMQRAVSQSPRKFVINKKSLFQKITFWRR